MSRRSDQILDAAERLLRHYGRNKTTVSDIAREAGIAVGSVYLEFETKDAIVAALSLDHAQRTVCIPSLVNPPGNIGIDTVKACIDIGKL